MKRQSSASPKPAAKKSKFSDLLIRLGSAAALISFEIFVICAGPIAIGLEIFLIQFIAVYEFVRISVKPDKESLLSFFIKCLPYLLAFLTSYYVSAPLFFNELVPKCQIKDILLDYHNFICFASLALLLVLFVINLTPENDSYAFTRLAWSILACVCLVAPANLYIYVANISLFWFITGVSLIAWNDTFAYFCGRLFGRHKLIALSPNKTVEGFVGALICTLVIGWFTPCAFAKIPYSYCPHVRPFNFNTECLTPPEFDAFYTQVSGQPYLVYPAQFHSLVIALFASLICPFGGFLGSGLKRAHGIKDFGNLIPGHGGIVDRCDCQFVMAAFLYFYLNAFVTN